MLVTFSAFALSLPVAFAAISERGRTGDVGLHEASSQVAVVDAAVRLASRAHVYRYFKCIRR